MYVYMYVCVYVRVLHQCMPTHSLVVMQREHQRQRRQGLLPPGEVGDVLPRLLGRTDGEHDACVAFT